jgi:hypothetical protein
MSCFDPMAAAVDWLDAYRAASLTIVSMYSGNASLECRCDGQQELTGRRAITEYWRQRFVEKPAGELVNLRPHGDAIVVSYRIPDGIVQSILSFDNGGLIQRSCCGPTSKELDYDASDGRIGPEMSR